MVADEGTLVTERMVFRRLTMDDVDRIHALHADPEVMRFISRTYPLREEIERTVIPSMIRGGERFPGFGSWAALDRSRGEFLGWFELDGTGDGSIVEPELGYRLRREEWGRGYAAEGARAMIAHAFSQPGVRRVWAQTMAVNRGSRRVMEKCGMRHVRTFFPHFDDPLPGTEQGEVEYAITRSEWIDLQRQA